MDKTTTRWTGRTYALSFVPAASVLAAWWMGGLWDAQVLTAWIAALVWAPTPLGIGMRLLDKDMDSYEEMLADGASLVQRLRGYAWLLTATNPLSRDLRVWAGTWTLLAVALAAATWPY